MFQINLKITIFADYVKTKELIILFWNYYNDNSKSKSTKYKVSNIV